jgi:hypothetical protein
MTCVNLSVDWWLGLQTFTKTARLKWGQVKIGRSHQSITKREQIEYSGEKTKLKRLDL